VQQKPQTDQLGIYYIIKKIHRKHAMLSRGNRLRAENTSLDMPGFTGVTTSRGERTSTY